MRRWIRVDQQLAYRLRDLTSVEFRAYVSALTIAAWQPEPGIFLSVRTLGAMLDDSYRGLSRTIPRLIETGRLERRPGGMVAVASWDEWQRPATSTERTRAFRARNAMERSRNAVTDSIQSREDKSVSFPNGDPAMAPADIPNGRHLEQRDGRWTTVADVVGELPTRPPGSQQVQRDQDSDRDPEQDGDREGEAESVHASDDTP